MAGRIIAQLLVSGGVILFRAAAQAYQQALANGQRAGGAEALKRATRGAQMTVEEARKILGVQQGAAWDVVEQRYKHLNEANQKTSFYLLSKVVRAKEALEEERPPGAAGGGQTGASGDSASQRGGPDTSST